MPRVGVKELKNRTTQIVRDVREHATEYVVTLDGNPVAVLRPYTADDEPSVSDEQIEAFLQRWDAMSKRVTAVWPSHISAVAAVREQRE